MSLKLLQPGIQPLGQFDVVDSELASFKGGEVCTFKYVTTNSQPGVTTSGLDQAAYDVFDGYVNNGTNFVRPAVTKTFTSGSTRPLFLSDDGILGYGTLFGAIVGGTVGQQVNGPNSYTGAVLGPHTSTGSGKMTLWDKPGLYAVSLDAVDSNATTGLQPTNTSLVGGDALYFTSSGLLTPTQTSAVSGSPVVARFIEFNTNQSLVTTPNYLVAALNSPSGNVSSVQARAFTYATISFNPLV
jgi:hypothetical protein